MRFGDAAVGRRWNGFMWGYYYIKWHDYFAGNDSKMIQGRLVLWWVQRYIEICGQQKCSAVYEGV